MVEIVDLYYRVTYVDFSVVEPSVASLKNNYYINSFFRASVGMFKFFACIDSFSRYRYPYKEKMF